MCLYVCVYIYTYIHIYLYIHYVIFAYVELGELLYLPMCWKGDDPLELGVPNRQTAGARKARRQPGPWQVMWKGLC